MGLTISFNLILRRDVFAKSRHQSVFWIFVDLSSQLHSRQAKYGKMMNLRQIAVSTVRAFKIIQVHVRVLFDLCLLPHSAVVDFLQQGSFDFNSCHAFEGQPWEGRGFAEGPPLIADF